MEAVENKLIGKECRFAVHIPTKDHDTPDYHLVKEVLHFEDGTLKPNIRIVRNFPRTFYVTEKRYRNHEQKKEREDLDKLVKYTCTQSDLRFAVAKALDQAFSPLPLQKLAASPYLYGSDISSTSIIKKSYIDKYPTLTSSYTTAFLDIETDVVNGTDDPIMVTVLYNKKLFFAADVKFYKGYDDIRNKYLAAVEKYIGPLIKKHGIEIEFFLAKDCTEMLSEAIKKLHEWQPDFVAIWNIGFDVPRMIETFEKYNVDPKNVFSDPRLPPSARFCKFKKGSTKKITASGQVKPKNPSEQWHSLLIPAGFWFIDQMSAYRFIRQGAQEEANYSLDHILEVNECTQKLKFNQASHLKEGQLPWHRFMQENFPFEYSVYNNVDCIGQLELEEKNSDLATSVPVRTNISDFSRFDSQTKRFADKYHFFLLDKKNSVIGTVPPSEKKEEEEADFIGEFEDDDEDNIVPVMDEDPEELSDEEKLEELIKDKDSVLGLSGWIN